MKNETTSTARYFIFLVLVFVAWIFLFKHLSKTDGSVADLFKMKKQSLSITLIYKGNN
jgi:hypothetical protein